MDDAAQLGANLVALRALTERWKFAAAGLRDQQEELDRALMAQSMTQLKAYRDVAAATRALREQISQLNAPSHSPAAPQLKPHHRQQRSSSFGSSLDSDGSGSSDQDSAGGMSTGDSGRPSRKLRDPDALRASALRSLSACMVRGNETLAGLEGVQFAPSTPLEAVMEQLGALQQAARAVAGAQDAAGALFRRGAYGGAAGGVDGWDAASDEAGAVDASGTAAGAAAAEAGAWVRGAWRRAEHFRNAMRAIAAAGVAESLKRLGWPPPPDAVPGVWVPPPVAPEDAEAAESKLAQGCMALALLQRWSVAWGGKTTEAAAAAPTTAHPAAPAAGPSPTPAAPLPVLWAVQIVAKPLVNRLRAYASAMVDRAQASSSPSAPAAGRDVTPVVPRALWTRGLDPAHLLAHVYDTFAALPGGLAAPLCEGPLLEGLRQGLAAGLMLWHELALQQHDLDRSTVASSDGGGGERSKRRRGRRRAGGGSTSLEGSSDDDDDDDEEDRRGISARERREPLDSEAEAEMTDGDVDAALFFDLRSAVLEQVLTEAVRICGGGAFEAAAVAASSVSSSLLKHERTGSAFQFAADSREDKGRGQDKSTVQKHMHGISNEAEANCNELYTARGIVSRGDFFPGASLITHGMVAAIASIASSEATRDKKKGGVESTAIRLLAHLPADLFLPSRLLDSSVTVDAELTDEGGYDAIVGEDGPHDGVTHNARFVNRYVGRPAYGTAHLLLIAPPVLPTTPSPSSSALRADDPLIGALVSPEFCEAARLRLLLLSEAMLLASVYAAQWRPLVSAYLSSPLQLPHVGSNKSDPADGVGPAAAFSLLHTSVASHFTSRQGRFRHLLAPHAAAVSSCLVSLLSHWIIVDCFACLDVLCPRKVGWWQRQMGKLRAGAQGSSSTSASAPESTTNALPTLKSTDTSGRSESRPRGPVSSGSTPGEVASAPAGLGSEPQGMPDAPATTHGSRNESDHDTDGDQGALQDDADDSSSPALSSVIGVGALMRGLLRSVSPLQKRVVAAVAPVTVAAAAAASAATGGMALASKGLRSSHSGSGSAVDVTDAVAKEPSGPAAGGAAPQQQQRQPACESHPPRVSLLASLLPLDTQPALRLAGIDVRAQLPPPTPQQGVNDGDAGVADEGDGSAGRVPSPVGPSPWNAALACACRVLTLMDDLLLPLAEGEEAAYGAGTGPEGGLQAGGSGGLSLGGTRLVPLPPTLVLARARAPLLRSLASCAARAFAASCRPWLVLVNVWCFRSYQEPALPVDAAAVARSALATACAELHDLLQWLPAQSGTVASSSRGPGGWYGDMLSLVRGGIDALTFQAVVEPTGFEWSDQPPPEEEEQQQGEQGGGGGDARSGGEGAGSTARRPLPRVPAGALLLLQALPDDWVLLQRACGVAQPEPAGPASALSSTNSTPPLFPAMRGVVSLVSVQPAAKAQSLCEAVVELLAHHHHSDDSDHAGRPDPAPGSAVEHVRDLLVAGAGLHPAAPLLTLASSSSAAGSAASSSSGAGRSGQHAHVYLAAAARALMAPACAEVARMLQ